MNPIKAAVLAILKIQNEAISEYQLMQLLEADGVELPDARASELGLFRRHFMVMNALYQIQRDVFDDGYHLLIGALEIRLKPRSVEACGQALLNEGELKLQAYYLDWDNLSQTSEQELADMLAQFWTRYYSLDKKQAALDTLGLAGDVSAAEIRDCYRRLAAQHHPDRGGDPLAFIDIRQAYEVLNQCPG
ncbi:MAG: DnaJ domain-containing protein [Gammaproteobacteria bacterium]|nr:DnaJ domain-containing protein [Gammaproteobacteria bacterium]